MSSLHFARAGLMCLYGAGQLSSPCYTAQGTAHLQHIDLPLTRWPLSLLLIDLSPPIGPACGFFIRGKIEVEAFCLHNSTDMRRLLIVHYREPGAETVSKMSHPRLAPQFLLCTVEFHFVTVSEWRTLKIRTNVGCRNWEAIFFAQSDSDISSSQKQVSCICSSNSTD